MYTMGVDYTAGPPPRLRSSPLSKLVKPHSVTVHHSGSGYNSLDAVPASVTYYFWEGGKSLNSSVCFLPPLCVTVYASAWGSQRAAWVPFHRSRLLF